MSEVIIKAEHVNPFIKATIETFATMVNMKVKPGKVKLRSESELSYDVSGIIGLSGGAKGSVALSFPRVTAMAIVRSFTGGDSEVTNSAMVDAIGELANIVAGAAKRDLAKYKITISLPTVVMGQKHAINGPVDSMNMVVPFEIEGAEFELGICFKSLL